MEQAVSIYYKISELMGAFSLCGMVIYFKSVRERVTSQIGIRCDSQQSICSNAFLTSCCPYSSRLAFDQSNLNESRSSFSVFQIDHWDMKFSNCLKLKSPIAKIIIESMVQGSLLNVMSCISNIGVNFKSQEHEMLLIIQIIKE